MNAQLEGIASTRRAAALLQIATERERVDRTAALGVIGQNGTARPAWQTAELEKVAADLDARAERLRNLTGDALVTEFCAEFMPAGR